MGDDKPNPMDDVKQGLGLLFRAAKTAASRLPTENVEGIVTEGAKEVGRAFETVASTIDEMWAKATGSEPPPAPPEAPPASPPGEAAASPETTASPEAPKEAPPPEEPRGPRVG